MSFRVYVSVADENRIAVFRMDTSTGELEGPRSIPVKGSPKPMAVDPSRRFLFVASSNPATLISYRVEAPTGDLTPVSESPLEADPCFLSTDRSGRHLLSAYFRPGMVTVHPVDEDGSVGQRPTECIRTKESSHSIQTDPSNRYAFVPHTRAHVVYQFRFDEIKGTLSPNITPKLHFEGEIDPRHFCFHPSLDVVYIVNERTSCITVCDFDPFTGELLPGERISTLPERCVTESKNSQIRITPSGRFLFASNRGHDSIASFSIDGATGALSPLGYTSTESPPRAFNLDPEGEYLFAAGRVSGRLAAYHINSNNGDLEEIGVYEVGAKPMWVSTVPTRHEKKTP